MTVIYSNMGDTDCLLLQRIWVDIPDVNLIEITPESEDWEDMVDNAIANEHDTIIFCGHGTTQGLLFPDYYRGEYIVHMSNVHLINAKNVICIWCNASAFCVQHNLHSFSTSMFISNINEAYDYGLGQTSTEAINGVCRAFHDEVNALLIDHVPLSDWVMRLGAHTDIENTIDTFNRQGLVYI